MKDSIEARPLGTTESVNQILTLKSAGALKQAASLQHNGATSVYHVPMASKGTTEHPEFEEENSKEDTEEKSKTISHVERE